MKRKEKVRKTTNRHTYRVRESMYPFIKNYTDNFAFTAVEAAAPAEK